MEKIEKTPWYLAAIAAIVIGAMCHIAFGWKFAPVVVAIALVWVSAKTTKWLLIIAVVLVGWQLFTSFLPQTASKGPFGLMQTDLFAAKQIDSVQIKANVILEAEKNRQKQAALGKYTELVRAGRVKEAQGLLDSINRVFTIEPVETDEPVQSDLHEVLHPGINRYQLKNIGDETPWLEYPDCIKYKSMITSSERNGYKVVYSNGSEYSSTDALPYGVDIVFKIVSIKNINQFVTIDVTLV